MRSFLSSWNTEVSNTSKMNHMFSYIFIFLKGYISQSSKMQKWGAIQSRLIDMCPHSMLHYLTQCTWKTVGWETYKVFQWAQHTDKVKLSWPGQHEQQYCRVWKQLISISMHHMLGSILNNTPGSCCGGFALSLLCFFA